jgi:hypothetical protein
MIIKLLGDYGIFCVKTKNGKLFIGNDLDYIDYDNFMDICHEQSKIYRK